MVMTILHCNDNSKGALMPFRQPSGDTISISVASYKLFIHVGSTDFKHW